MRTRLAIARAVPRVVADLAEWGVTDVHWFVAFHGEPVLWLETTTDAEKAEVFAHDCFADRVRALLAEAGLPDDLAARAQVTVESAEAVERDFEGRWFYAMK